MYVWLSGDAGGFSVLTSVKTRFELKRGGRCGDLYLDAWFTAGQHGQKEKEKEKEKERKRCLPIVLVAPRIHRLLPYPYGPR